MSLFDQAKQAAANLTGGMSDQHAQLTNGVMELLSSQTGGLSGLVQAFHDNGLGDTINSWIGSGQNLPVSGDQITSVLGSGAVQQLDAKAGVTPDVAKAKLVEVLPTLVDRLTPEGKVPEGGGLLGAAKSLMKGQQSS